MSIYYLAYGSNLHPLRLLERIPSSYLVGPVELANHQLHFHKRGEDLSGKCNIIQTHENSDRVYCALYHMDEQHKLTLDKIEGPGYTSKHLQVQCNNEFYQCFVYVAEDSHIDKNIMPFDWYHTLVHIGARYHGFPEEYIANLQSIKTQEDSNPERQTRNQKLIERMFLLLPGVGDL